MKAIETHYRGYRFRSRLEARWAVFLDAMRAQWEYEPEGFTDGEVSYLPDFRLFGRLWLEVKPHADVAAEERLKWEMLVRMTDLPLLVVFGTPHDDDELVGEPVRRPTTGGVLYESYPDGQFQTSTANVCECRRCGHTADNGVRLVLDHVQPVARGGTNDVANLQTLCQPCNAGKSARLPHAHDLRHAGPAE